MSLWLQSVLGGLEARDYERVGKMLPLAPIPIPDCLHREFEFGQRCCRDESEEPLFPIRFLWMMELHEQQMFGLPVPGRSRYHPEILLYDVWEKAYSDDQHRRQLESEGFRFNLAENAVATSMGWILIGDSFIEDFVSIEDALGGELLFTDSETGKRSSAFQNYKQQCDSNYSPTACPDSEEEEEEEPATATLRPDKHIENADWPKRTWDLPPYKSEEFMRLCPDLDAFRRLPVYKFAVAKGLIQDDEWVGTGD